MGFLLGAEEESGGSMDEIPCEFIIALVFIFLVVYVIFLIYQHFIGRWAPREHYCKYCGRMVMGVSDCCHSFVDDSMVPNVCRDCGMDCRTVCTLCKRIL